MDGLFRRRRLPHLDVDGGTYFITACLAGSIPSIGLKALNEYRNELEAQERPANISASDWQRRLQKLLFARVDEWLDHKPAVRHFIIDLLAQCVQDSLFHFAGERYDLLAFCIMPSHLHWVLTPIRAWCDEVVGKQRQAGSLPHKSGAGFQPAVSHKSGAGFQPAVSRFRSPREIIMHSLKSFTAQECNRILGLSGAFWQDESYDHVVRDDDELQRVIHYVEQNPVNARHVAVASEWKWSSAAERLRTGIRIGDPLRKEKE